MGEKAFLIDTTKCMGCRACQVACKQWNNLPAEDTSFFAAPEYTNPKGLSAITYNLVRFYELDREDPEKPLWQIMHQKCYHCEEPNCLRVCPVKAISKRGGWVVIDQNICIGCGACQEECVYNVPHVSDRDFNEYGIDKPIKKNKAYKCHACTVNERDIPACAAVCPTKSILYDDRIKVLDRASKRLKKIKDEYPKASIYGKDQFSGLHVITILKDKPEKYGLESSPKPIEISMIKNANRLYSILSTLTLGLPSLKRRAYRISRIIITKGSNFS
ncbi:MAG: 4Fe-4S dicluster domain-containing protein [Spirochaetota bacterium]|nr:4Fe-4S dicluster domain-containing protein [Spirochaetota bacterium]